MPPNARSNFSAPRKPGSAGDGNASTPTTPTLAAEAESVRWTGRTRGGYFGNWFFVQLIRWLGLRWAYAWLVFIAAYFTFASPRNFRWSKDYLRRVRGPQPFWKWPGLVYRHFYSFGVALLDRVAVIMGRAQIHCTFDGEEQFTEHLARGQGIILVGAHVGGWEMGGHLLGRLGKPVNVVVMEREAARIRALFDAALRDKQFRLLTTDGHPLRSVPIAAALRRGEIVALHGDRAFGGADLAVPFLGGDVRFPVGPYLLAAFTGAPLFHAFTVRERFGQYRCFTYPPLTVPRTLLRADPEALRPWLEEYAGRLAAVVREHPFQWFNIYPYWETPPAAATPSQPPSVPTPEWSR